MSVSREKLDTLEREAVEVLRKELSAGESGANDLKLTGIEVLVFIAGRVVLPIVCGLISRALYDAYKNIRTRQEAEQVRERVVTAETGEPVDDETLVTDIEAVLASEGVPSERRRPIAETLVRATKQRLRGA